MKRCCFYCKLSICLICATLFLIILTSCIFTISILAPIDQFNVYSECRVIERIEHSSIFHLKINNDVCKFNVYGKIMYFNNKPYLDSGCPKDWYVNTTQNCYCNDLDCFHLPSSTDANLLMAAAVMIMTFVIIPCCVGGCYCIVYIIGKIEKKRKRKIKKGVMLDGYTRSDLNSINV